MVIPSFTAAGKCTRPGNPLTHTILRGAVNKHGQCIPELPLRGSEASSGALYKSVIWRIRQCIVDANHSNSNKQYDRAGPYRQRSASQPEYPMRNRSTLVKGVMIESYIEPGSQKIGQGEHIYGKSITDPCLGWAESEQLIHTIDKRRAREINRKMTGSCVFIKKARLLFSLRKGAIDEWETMNNRTIAFLLLPGVSFLCCFRGLGSLQKQKETLFGSIQRTYGQCAGTGIFHGRDFDAISHYYVHTEKRRIARYRRPSPGTIMDTDRIFMLLNHTWSCIGERTSLLPSPKACLWSRETLQGTQPADRVIAGVTKKKEKRWDIALPESENPAVSLCSSDHSDNLAELTPQPVWPGDLSGSFARLSRLLAAFLSTAAFRHASLSWR